MKQVQCCTDTGSSIIQQHFVSRPNITQTTKESSFGHPSDPIFKVKLNN